LTKLRGNKPLVRETDVFERSDALVVSLYPKTLEIRLKGGRQSFLLEYGAILDLARKLDYRRGLRKGA
jgi:hypothetical protein